jgi:uncharacterized iron-regulated membrane protein
MWRKFHFWVGLVIVVQVVLWLVSGIGFSVLYNRALGGERQTSNLAAPPIAVRSVRIAADDLPRLLEQRLGHRADVTSVALQSHVADGRPVYVVGIKESDAPAVIDARDGSWVGLITAHDAAEIATRDFTGDAEIESVENITYPYQKGYDYFGQLPVYRVNFANWKGTRIYVSPYTGDIRLRRNVDKTLFDLFWTLHMFGYVSHDIDGNLAMIATGAISMVSVVTGLMLYLPRLKSALRRRRRR